MRLWICNPAPRPHKKTRWYWRSRSRRAPAIGWPRYKMPPCRAMDRRAHARPCVQPRGTLPQGVPGAAPRRFQPHSPPQAGGAYPCTRGSQGACAPLRPTAGDAPAGRPRRSPTAFPAALAAAGGRGISVYTRIESLRPGLSGRPGRSRPSGAVRCDRSRCRSVTIGPCGRAAPPAPGAACPRAGQPPEPAGAAFEIFIVRRGAPRLVEDLV